MIGTLTFTDRALAAVRRDLSIIPGDVKGKGPYGLNAGKPRWGAKSRTNTEEGVRAFAAKVPADANYCICSDETFTILETDDLASFSKLLSSPLPETLAQAARENRRALIFRQTPRTREVLTNTIVPGLFEWRHVNFYVVGFGSVHPTGAEYRIICDKDPVEMPDWLVDDLLELKRKAPPSSKTTGQGVPAVEAVEAIKNAIRDAIESDDYDLYKAVSGLEGVSFADSNHPSMLAIIGFLHNDKLKLERDELVDLAKHIWAEYGDISHMDRDEVEGMVDATQKKPPCTLGTYGFWGEDESEHSLKWALKKEDLELLKTATVVSFDLEFAREVRSMQADTQCEPGASLLLSHKSLREARNAAPSPEIVEGLIPEKSVNGVFGDSGLGKTPLMVQLAVCVSLGRDFLGFKTRQSRVMFLDYENFDDLLDVIDQVLEHLGMPPEFQLDPAWFCVVQNPISVEETRKAIDAFKPQLIIVDSLRGFDPAAETKSDAAARMISSLQQVNAAWMVMHHLRKNPAESQSKRLPLIEQERVIDWLDSVSGARALVNQTRVRFAIDHLKTDDSDLVVRGFYKGCGELGPWKLKRHIGSSGEPIGYNRIMGRDLLDIVQQAYLDLLPNDTELFFRQIVETLSIPKWKAAEFLKACETAGVLTATGKHRSRNRCYIFKESRYIKPAPLSPDLMEAVQKCRASVN